MSKLIAILSMLATLGIAYGLDRWILYLRKLSSADFNNSRSLWGMVIANLVIGILWVFLAWWVFLHNSRSLWVGTAFIMVGLLFAFPMQLLIIDQTRYIRAALLEIGFGSLFALSAAYIAVLGIASLLPRRAPT